VFLLYLINEIETLTIWFSWVHELFTEVALQTQRTSHIQFTKPDERNYSE